MRKFIMFFAVMAIMAGVTNKVVGQVTLSENQAGAELVQALTITNPTPLQFGRIAVPATGGYVTLSTAGLRTPSGKGISIVLTGTAKTAAVFSLTGTSGATYSFTLPSSITVTYAGSNTGTKTMAIDNFVVDVDAAGEVPYSSIGTCTLTGGNSSVVVGGKLTIGATQAIGIYNGTYTVIVDYL